MAAKKKAAAAAEKPTRRTRQKAQSLFQVSFGGTTKVVSAGSASEVKRSVLAGFSIVKLSPVSAFEAADGGAKIESLAGSAELGLS